MGKEAPAWTPPNLDMNTLPWVVDKLELLVAFGKKNSVKNERLLFRGEIFFFLKFKYFNWRLMTLQYCIRFAIHQHKSNEWWRRTGIQQTLRKIKIWKVGNLHLLSVPLSFSASVFFSHQTRLLSLFWLVALLRASKITY